MGLFFSQPNAPNRGHGPFTVVRHPTKTTRTDGDVSVGPRYTRDGSLSSIVPFCLRLRAPFLHPGFVCLCSRILRFLARTDGKKQRREVSMGISQPTSDVNKYNTWYTRFYQGRRARTKREGKIARLTYKTKPQAFTRARVVMR